MGGERLKSGAEREGAWLLFVRNRAINAVVWIDDPYSAVGGDGSGAKNHSKSVARVEFFSTRKFGVFDYSLDCYQKLPKL